MLPALPLLLNCAQQSQSAMYMLQVQYKPYLLVPDDYRELPARLVTQNLACL